MAEIPSEVRSVETSDLPSGESRRLRRRIRKASGKRTLTTAQREKIQERPVLGKNQFLPTNWSQDQIDGKSSYKEHRVDALAPYAEEGRGKLRKATGSRKQAPIRRYPNGETRQLKRLSP